MSDLNNLASRLDAEFSAVEEKIKQYQVSQLEEYKERQKRLEKLTQVFDELREIWQPRLEMLVEKFGDRVKVTPRIVPSAREATFDFQSKLAHVRLKFSATTDRDIHKVILSYNLDIIPVFLRFKPHDEIEFPLTAVDKKAAAQWIDDRIIEFVQTYFSLGENDVYMKEQMVEDPVAHVRFPKIAAAATLERGGETYYFIGEETCREFEEKEAVGAK